MSTIADLIQTRKHVARNALILKRRSYFLGGRRCLIIFGRETRGADFCNFCHFCHFCRTCPVCRSFGGPQNRLARMLDPPLGRISVAKERLKRCTVSLQNEAGP